MSPPSRWTVAVCVAAFRVATRAFPKGFRSRHGAEMVDAFRSALVGRAARGGRPVAAYVARALADVVRRGVAERLRALGAGRLAPPEPGRWNGGGRGMLEGVGMDVRLALRGLRSRPAFAGAALVVVALGIGTNTAVFGALRLAVLSPPPYPEVERLALVELTRRSAADEPAQPLSWSFPKYLTFLERPDLPFDRTVAYAARTVTLTGAGPAEVVEVEMVTPGYFELLGWPPVQGRGFSADELRPAGSDGAVVLSWELWRGRFDADPTMLGRRVTLNGVALPVVGVAPRGFEGLTGGGRLWISMGAAGRVFAPASVEQAQTHWFHVLGRLRPGVAIEDARARMESIGLAIDRQHPSGSAGRIYSATARTLSAAAANERTRRSVVMLTAAALLVLFVACANLSGLMLTRARRRGGAGAVRLALGAGRWRLVRAALIESVVLSMLGALGGLWVAAAAMGGMAAAWPTAFRRGEAGDLLALDPTRLALHGPELAFALASALVAAALVGGGPALLAARGDLSAALEDRGSLGASRRRSRVSGRGLLVSGQVAVALVLLVGTGLLAGSALRLLRVDVGFDPEDLLSFSYTIPRTSRHAESPLDFHEALVERVRALPGVEDATFGCPPLRGHCIITRVDAVRDAPEIPPGEGLRIGVRMVDDRHFEALGVPVTRGRAFVPGDGADATPAVVLNELAARRLFGDGEAIGRRIALGMGASGKEAFSEVVGVVGDVLYSGPEDGMMAEAYFSLREYPENHGSVTVRVAGDPLAAVPALRRELGALDPTIAMFRVETMDALVADGLGDRGLTLSLLGLFALSTVLLAAAGTWGTVAYSVADRRREIGLRLALGAGHAAVRRSVVHGALRAGIAGLALGVGAALVSVRFVESLLWGVERTEPAVYAGAALLLVLVVVGASWLPARNAAGVDPADALRAE